MVRERYSVFLTISAVALLPMFLLAPVSASVSWSTIYILTAICTSWSSASLILGMAAMYRGETLATADVLMRAGARIAGRFIVIALVRNIAFWIGLILFVIPGLLALAYFALVAPVAAIEDLSARKALIRGAALAKGEYPRIIRIMGGCFLVYGLAIRVVATVVGMLTLSMPMAYLGGILVQAVLQPVMIAIAVFLYYDIRERREGLDIEIALAAAGTHQGTAPSA